MCDLLQNWIGETILEDFQEDFVVDIEAEYVRGYVYHASTPLKYGVNLLC